MKGIIINSIITITLLGLFYLMLDKSKEKYGYVKFGILYDEFQMKKDLEGKLKNVQSARKSYIDSLEFQIGLMGKRLQSKGNANKNEVSDFEYQRELFFQKKQQFTEDNQAMVDQYNSQIIKKINESVVNYGKLNGYTFIFGANGDASIMHAADEKDITGEVVKYINKTYTGK